MLVATKRVHQWITDLTFDFAAETIVGEVRLSSRVKLPETHLIPQSHL
jgi:hypothetical protein